MAKSSETLQRRSALHIYYLYTLRIVGFWPAPSSFVGARLRQIRGEAALFL